MIDCDVIHSGEFGANALIYKPLSQSALDYLSNRLDSTLSTMKGVSQRFVDTVKGMYDRFNSTEAIQRAKMVLHSAGTHFSQDVIYPVRYDTYNNMNLIMQRYVMSQPEINKMYNKNKCYGFKDTYLDPEPNAYGEDRFDYQRVMDGFLRFDSDGNGYFNHYSNSDIEDELTTLDKISVLDTWDVAVRILAEGKDPTHPELESF